MVMVYGGEDRFAVLGAQFICCLCFVLCTSMYHILCPWFSCRTVSDRCLFPCVHSLSCLLVSFRFRCPSVTVDVTVLSTLTCDVFCVHGFHVGRLQTIANLRVLILCHAMGSSGLVGGCHSGETVHSCGPSCGVCARIRRILLVGVFCWRRVQWGQWSDPCPAPKVQTP